MEYFIAIILAYIMGSISPSVLLGKYLFKRDLRAYGSHNPGTANSVYVFGFTGGFLVFLGDVMKGLLPVLIVDSFLTTRVEEPLLLLLITAFFAILGHCHSIFLKLKGGKGFATFIGVTLYLFPSSALFLFIAFMIALLISKYISIGTFTVVTLSPLVQIYKHYGDQTFTRLSWLVLAALSLLVIYEHRENIIKLINGKEIPVTNPRISQEELDLEGDNS